MSKFGIDFSRLTEQTAKGMYYGASNELKEALEKHFGSDLFDVTGRVKTIYDARQELSKIPNELKQSFIYGSTEKENAFYLLRMITIALNGGDLTVEDDRWAPSFYRNGFSFRSSVCYSRSDFLTLNLSKNLYFKSKELSDYAGKQFLELYKDFIL